MIAGSKLTHNETGGAQIEHRPGDMKVAAAVGWEGCCALCLRPPVMYPDDGAWLGHNNRMHSGSNNTPTILTLHKNYGLGGELLCLCDAVLCACALSLVW